MTCLLNFSWGCIHIIDRQHIVWSIWLKGRKMKGHKFNVSNYLTLSPNGCRTQTHKGSIEIYVLDTITLLMTTHITCFLYKNQYIWTWGSIFLNFKANFDLVKGGRSPFFKLKTITNDPSTNSRNSFKIRSYVYEIVKNIGLKLRLVVLIKLFL